MSEQKTDAIVFLLRTVYSNRMKVICWRSTAASYCTTHTYTHTVAVAWICRCVYATGACMYVVSTPDASGVCVCSSWVTSGQSAVSVAFTSASFIKFLHFLSRSRWLKIQSTELLCRVGSVFPCRRRLEETRLEETRPETGNSLTPA